MSKSRECFREEIVHVYVNPEELRRWADEMEKKMSTVLPGQLVWTYPLFGDYGLKVMLTADQGWFHDRNYWSTYYG